MYFSCLILFVGTTCEEDPLTYEEERAELDIYKETIETLAASSICNESTECLFIAFGSKPCGGPWTYLYYTNSIDVEKLELWVEDYNQLESQLNEDWGIVSDCAAVIPPSSMECENNQCIPVN